MLRTEGLENISDGRKYKINDMVRADAGGCKGCSKCCETMSETIILNPLDVFRMSRATKMSFESLIASGKIELNMYDGIILPNIKNNGSGCGFLLEGRCQIHSERPDICRLFPLGRVYEGDGFSYILQTGECDKTKSKIKVKKWIGIENHEAYADFLMKWHGVVKTVREKVAFSAEGDGEPKKLLMTVLAFFYQMPYDLEADFYEQFEDRLSKITI